MPGVPRKRALEEEEKESTPPSPLADATTPLSSPLALPQGLKVAEMEGGEEYGLWESHCWGQSPSSPGPASTAPHRKAKHYVRFPSRLQADIATSSSPSPHRHLIVVVVVVVAALATVTTTVTVITLPVRPPSLSRVCLAP
ncbi:hypothetical protein BOTBODRAFT_174241 [Botryobasidium botryosum FD-172 SS1]|uniref:Uncharacterized protein n=1 Tax=Botryobasidium botryosum (strain FD-172 SS1) TaxID=930990 RepID=A0A067MK02_BOTB1|nr:hypothetical protein BOTBODRAFT_174241 [Botryobasidium botryosum FD-172 SS1]